MSAAAIALAAAGGAALAFMIQRRRALERSLAEVSAQSRRLSDDFKATVDALARDRAQLSSILAHVVEGIVAVDGEGRLIAANPALRAIFGVAETAGVGRPFVETLRHPKLQDLLSAVLKEGGARVEEVSLFAAEERHFEAHAVPLIDSGRRAGALLVLHDITRLRRLERMRREFVANVSHELRTPLASIRGFAETLRDGALEDKEHRVEFVEAIEKDAERLSALVEDLLDLSAIESGQRPLAREKLDVGALARETAASLRPLAERRGVKIEVDAARAPLVSADRGQIKQVLGNLLDNAVKFNREGGSVWVTIAEDHGFLAVSVRDDGPGIPPEDLPRVFERFYRVDKARSREVGGTGLGLSIAKHIVEAHGGAVSATSVVSEGSTFRFTLPM